MIAAAAARAKVGAVIGGGLLGLEAAKALQGPRPRDARRRVRAAADGGAARRLPAGRLLRRKIEALGATVHVSKNTKEIVAGRARAATSWSSPTAPAWRPTSSCSPPASGRATSWRAPPGSRSASAAASASIRTARPPTPTSTPSANARCGKGASSAWSRPATRWRRSPRATSPARRRCSSSAPT